MKWSLLLSLVLFAMTAQAAETPKASTAQPQKSVQPQNSAQPQQSTEPDFDSLGGNTILLERARALEPDKNVSIVQGRTVDRRKRVELSPELSGIFGGQTYTTTKSLGLNAHFHFTPRFSVGAKYSYFFNSLSEEGNALADNALADREANPQNPTVPYPQLDWAKDELLAMMNWYPLYGKINWFDKSVVHFDIYALAGYGQVRLESGNSPTYTAGGGIGFWFNQHLSTRFEMRYQNYTAEYFTGKKDMDLTVGSFQMGWIL